MDSNYITLLSKAMDAYALRQKITASNIANLDTQGYNKLKVSFEDELRQAQQMGNESYEGVDAEVVATNEEPILENQMLIMTDTQIRVQLVAKALRENFELIQTGITGRP